MDNRFTDLAQRDRNKYRDVREWRYEPVRGRFLERDSVLRGAMRSIDEHHDRYPKLTDATALVWMFVIGACAVSLVYLLFG